jgi:hypothetical protein
LNNRHWLIVGITIAATLLVACSLPRVSAEERVFLDLQLQFLGAYELPNQTVAGTRLGGLSAIVYDANGDRFYALSDEHDDGVTPHFYTLKLDLTDDPAQPQIAEVQVESVTFLLDSDGNPYPSDALDPEGLALSPQNTLYLSSEGINRREVPPALLEFDLQTGKLLHQLPIPQRFTMAIDETTRRQQQGVQFNLGFESLTLAPVGNVTVAGEPLRLFTANEAPLVQDLDLDNEEDGGRDRFLHYYLGVGAPLLLAEYVYALEPVSLALVNGLSEILALDNGGHFLTLERALTPFGFQIHLFQASLAGASDSSGLSSLRGKLGNITKIRKQLLFDLKTVKTLGIPLRNLEGMALGPHLADGDRTLLIISDNNFSLQEPTQFLLFRLQ